MIYTCKHCGASFTAKEMNEAFANELKFLTCRYCGNDTEVTDMKGSNVYSGYEHLADSDFFQAEERFIHAIEDSERKGLEPPSAAYLGAALARFHVQTVFSDEKKTDFPSLICHDCNENYISDDTFFINAQNVKNLDSNERTQMRKYEDFIDGIKENYDKIAQKHEQYDIFIAFEDDKIDINELMKMDERYTTVSNWFDRKYYKVYGLDVERDRDLKYEAEILYAINHSKSMLVLNDDDINSRLRSIYSRFFSLYRKKHSKGDVPILFARYYGKSSVTLPDRSRSAYVFDIDRKSEITTQFAHWLNKGVDGGTIKITVDETPKVHIDPEPPKFDDQPITPAVNVLPVYIKEDVVTFGEYPQRRVLDSDIIEHFYDLEDYDENTCHALYKNKSGRVVAWYRDDVIGEKKYRGVFYYSMRKAFSKRDRSIDGEQRNNKYEKSGICYCFEFTPIEWDVEKRNGGISALISRSGLDSVEFNNEDFNSDWFDSTINSWLNNEFMETAFTEEQIYCLMQIDAFGESKVFLPDKKLDNNHCMSFKGRKGATDYFKCVGGAVDVSGGGVRSFWVTGDNADMRGDEAVVMNPNLGGYGSQYVDCTHVAVVPKVVLRF